jgi:hypothetical protein
MLLGFGWAAKLEKVSERMAKSLPQLHGGTKKFQ